MPEKYRKRFINVFSKLKQRVLWKWETETMDDLAKNVKLSKWVPQQDVLGSSGNSFKKKCFKLQIRPLKKLKAVYLKILNWIGVRMFITHGGLLSSQEAIYHGVPLIGFPMYGDQALNMKQAVSSGYAISLDFIDVTEDELLAAIKRILTEPM